MIPEKIRFTGLTIDPFFLIDGGRELRNRAIPKDWYRIEFDCPARGRSNVTMIRKWVNDNSDGRWCVYTSSDTKTVVAYELAEDAVMFKLKDGHTAWQNTEEF